MAKLTVDEVDLIAERLDHRFEWMEKGYMTDDLRYLVGRLVDHARKTAKDRKAKDRVVTIDVTDAIAQWTPKSPNINVSDV